MRLEHLTDVISLKDSLKEAEATLAAFEMARRGGEPHCNCKAYLPVDFGRRGASVELMHVPIDHAVAAAQRQVSTIKDRLQELGVEV